MLSQRSISGNKVLCQEINLKKNQGLLSVELGFKNGCLKKKTGWCGLIVALLLEGTGLVKPTEQLQLPLLHLSLLLLLRDLCEL